MSPGSLRSTGMLYASPGAMVARTVMAFLPEVCSPMLRLSVVLFSICTHAYTCHYFRHNLQIIWISQNFVECCSPGSGDTRNFLGATSPKVHHLCRAFCFQL